MLALCQHLDTESAQSPHDSSRGSPLRSAAAMIRTLVWYRMRPRECRETDAIHSPNQCSKTQIQVRSASLPAVEKAAARLRRTSNQSAEQKAAACFLVSYITMHRLWRILV